ncbi:MAG: hypothetical protein WA952_03720 [Lewinella sp.]
MYTPWLKSDYQSNTELSSSTVGRRLSGSASSGPQVALIGLQPEWANAVRDKLFAHYWDHGDLNVTDLGNLRKQTVDFAIPLFKELYASGTLPVLLGANARMAEAQYLAFAELNREIGICTVDSRVQLNYTGGEDKAKTLDRAVHRKAAPAFHLAHIGDQRHLSDARLDVLFLSRHFERYSLGKSRSDLTDLEPAIRDVDLTIMDITSVIAAEAPAQSGTAPSGFSLQEAGQLAYYAGNSDRLASFGVYGYESTGVPRLDDLTAAAYAQLIWYFLHGVSRRHADFPTSSSGLVEYIVDSKMADRFVFWRSPRSDRWWVQIPLDAHRGEERNRLVSCSYADYVATSQEGHLPERLFHAFSRY